MNNDMHSIDGSGSDISTVLIVDDNSTNLKILSDYLTGSGLKTLIAKDGKSAIERAEYVRPDLILLDVLLPGIDGFEVCRRLKSCETTHDIPVIFITALIDMERKIEGFQAGAVDYITKPFHKEEVLLRVSTHLRLRQLTETLEREVEKRTQELVKTNQQLQKEIEERIQTEKSLNDSEERFRRLAENAKDMIYRMSLPDGKYEYISPASESIFGYTPDDFYKNQKMIANIIHPDWREYFTTEWNKLIHGEMSPVYEYKILHPSGESKWLNQRNVLIRDEDGRPFAIEGIVTDITDHKNIEEQLKLALDEKTMLLRELYHRTKNNMQVIQAMLSLRSSHTENSGLQPVLDDIQEKIYSMALIHQKLYESENLSSVNLKEYIEELSVYFLDFYQVKPHRISFRLDIENISVSIDTAIPFGLILSEFISNAFKHAFPRSRLGTINIHLHKTSPKIVTLQFFDDGIGLPKNFDINNIDSLGLQTAIGIAEHQLQGKISFRSDSGTFIEFSFYNNLYKSRV